MVRFLNYLFVLVFLFLIIFSCAKKGSPTGGPKDETAPLMVVTKPAHKSTFFKEEEIRIYFDEYIVLKDLNSQLIVSPPLKTPAVITPQGTASKYIKIKILDELRPNTTYTFNFGNAVRDNNEGNIIEDFKYIFSTGSYIDSLKSTGSVISSLDGKLKKNVSVLLYEYDSTYTDSAFYQQKPKYVTKTVDSLHFEFTNIKEGKYLLLAIDEEASDYMFNPRKDKIAFFKDTIYLPKDSILNKNLELFKEEPVYKFKRGKETSRGKILFGYEGRPENMKVNLMSDVPNGFKAFSKFEKDADTLSYWFTPIEGLDSLNFTVFNKNAIVDTLTVRLRKKKLDSLQINATVSGTLNPRDTFFLKSNNPIVNIDKSKFSLISDSIPVNYDLKKQEVDKIALIFEKEFDKSYSFNGLPEGISDLYGCTNDSISYKFKTKTIEDYGSIALEVKKEIPEPVIVELLSKDKVIRTSFVKENSTITFEYLEPLTYKIRAIIDDNKNNRWDTGNYLLKVQPERIIYIDKELELRPNWSLNETLTIE